MHTSTDIQNGEPERTAPDPEDALRAQLYGLLGGLLTRAPDRELLEGLAAIEVADEQRGDALAAAWSMLAMAARRASPEAVDEEYHALFIGIGRGELVPYASWYLTGFMMERPLAELRQDLKRLGYERRDEVREPEDHAGALLETMGLMASDGSGISRHEQKGFFDRHMAPWMGKFFTDMQNAHNAVFYSAVGVLGAGFMKVEEQYLAMLPH